MTASMRDKEGLIWREIAIAFVTIVVLSVMFFTLWEQGQSFGESKRIPYFHFLSLTLTATIICIIIFYTINFLEKLFSTTDKVIVKITLTSGFLLCAAAAFYWFFYTLFLAVNFRDTTRFLILLGIISIVLFHICFARFTLKRALYEVCLRVLFPIVIFILFLVFTVDRINEFNVLYITSLAYFLPRPFVNQIFRIKSIVQVD